MSVASGYILRPFLPQDEDFFRYIESTGLPGVLYRLRGVSLSSEAYHAALWNGVLVQEVVADSQTGEPFGLVCCYGADMRNGHARIAAIFTEDARIKTWPLAGVSEFIDHIFEVFPLRKLYADVHEFNLEQFRAVLNSDVLVTEGRLGSHEYHAGRYWDLVMLAVYRERWEEFRGQAATPDAASLDNARQLFAALGHDLDELDGSTELTRLGLDSLAMAELIEVISAGRGFSASDDLISGLCTVTDVRFFCSSEIQSISPVQT